MLSDDMQAARCEVSSPRARCISYSRSPIVEVHKGLLLGNHDTLVPDPDTSSSERVIRDQIQRSVELVQSLADNPGVKLGFVSVPNSGHCRDGLAAEGEVLLLHFPLTAEETTAGLVHHIRSG
jgi:hypothetical protein